MALSLRIKSNLKIAIVCLNFFLELLPVKEEPHLMNKLIGLLKEERQEDIMGFF